MAWPNDGRPAAGRCPPGAATGLLLARADGDAERGRSRHSRRVGFPAGRRRDHPRPPYCRGCPVHRAALPTGPTVGWRCSTSPATPGTRWAPIRVAGPRRRGAGSSVGARDDEPCCSPGRPAASWGGHRRVPRLRAGAPELLHFRGEPVRAGCWRTCGAPDVLLAGHGVPRQRPVHGAAVLDRRVQARQRLSNGDHPLFQLPEGRQEGRAARRSEPRVCADSIEAAGVDRVVTVDLHAPQVQGFFKVRSMTSTRCPPSWRRAEMSLTGPRRRFARRRLRQEGPGVRRAAPCQPPSPTSNGSTTASRPRSSS